DYRAQRYDELSFPKHAIISHVVKHDKGWWRGDYGGKRQHWFPENYVTEVDVSTCGSVVSSSTDEQHHHHHHHQVLGCASSQSPAAAQCSRGTLHLAGATVHELEPLDGGPIKYAFKIVDNHKAMAFQVGVTIRKPENTQWEPRTRVLPRGGLSHSRS